MWTLRILPLFLVLSACGATPPKQAADPSTEPSSSAPPEPAAESAATQGEGAPKAAAAETAEPAPAKADHVKIQFPPNAGVEEAIKAVPQGTPRVNMSDDALQKPLMNVKQYESCKVPRSMRVSISVAVFDGAAVGVDITTKPKNPKMESCLNDVVRKLSWDRVPSLNTVTFNL